MTPNMIVLCYDNVLMSLVNPNVVSVSH